MSKGKSINVSWPGVDPEALKRTAAERGIRDTGSPWSVSEYIRKAVEAYSGLLTSDSVSGGSRIGGTRATGGRADGSGANCAGEFDSASEEDGIFRLTELGEALVKHPDVALRGYGESDRDHRIATSDRRRHVAAPVNLPPHPVPVRKPVTKESQTRRRGKT